MIGMYKTLLTAALIAAAYGPAVQSQGPGANTCMNQSLLVYQVGKARDRGMSQEDVSARLEVSMKAHGVGEDEADAIRNVVRQVYGNLAVSAYDLQKDYLMKCTASTKEGVGL